MWHGVPNGSFKESKQGPNCPDNERVLLKSSLPLNPGTRVSQSYQPMRCSGQSEYLTFIYSKQSRIR